MDPGALRDLFSDLVRLETELWNAVDARLRAVELTLGRYETLRAVARRGGCRVQEIADELVVTQGGISKLVDKLVVSGHLHRGPHPTDGRSSLLSLTIAGERLLEDATAIVDAALASHFPLPDGDLTAFADTLTRLRAGTEGRTR